jgi:uncharacterized membrane protein
MLKAFLIGLVAGQRAMTPLALITGAARRGDLPEGTPQWLSHPLVAAGAVTLAASEMAGDKMKTAPDRIILPGLIGRGATGAFAGAMLVPKEQRVAAGLLAGATAIAASFIGFRMRVAAIKRYGQTATGFVEDAAVLAGGLAVVRR